MDAEILLRAGFELAEGPIQLSTGVAEPVGAIAIRPPHLVAVDVVATP